MSLFQNEVNWYIEVDVTIWWKEVDFEEVIRHLKQILIVAVESGSVKFVYELCNSNNTTLCVADRHTQDAASPEALLVHLTNQKPQISTGMPFQSRDFVASNHRRVEAVVIVGVRNIDALKKSKNIVRFQHL